MGRFADPNMGMVESALADTINAGCSDTDYTQEETIFKKIQNGPASAAPFQ